MDAIIYEIENIVRQTAAPLKNVHPTAADTEEKEGIGNYVTRYDKETQSALEAKLSALLPEAIFIGEEEDHHKKVAQKGYTFIIDPIDGTANFARGLSLSFVSVALLKDGEQYLAVCYNPYLDEMFTAQKGKGAYLNGEAISVSDKKLCEGLVFTGSAPYYEETRQKTLTVFQNFVAVAADFRRLGSAVMEICDIACGRAEAYFEVILQPWDYAAATLLVTEAGGKVSDMEGAPLSFDKPCSILVTNGTEDYFKYLS